MPGCDGFLPVAEAVDVLRQGDAAHDLKILPAREKAAQQVIWSLRESPLGTALIAVCADRLCWLGFADRGRAYLRERFAVDWSMADCHEATHPLMTAALKKQPARLPLLVSGTPFQIEVWQALLKIPRGYLVRYGDIAAALGRPRAARAVGAAVGANPVSWLIPCHRVGHGDGGLQGFGWGKNCKLRLLGLEGVGEVVKPRRLSA